MGWNSIKLLKKEDVIAPLQKDYYFVHSYYVPICNETIGVSKYSTEFSAVIEKDNFFGTQFHPEKSGLAGERILKSFVNL